MKIIALGADLAAPVHEDDRIPLIATGRPVASGAPRARTGPFFPALQGAPRRAASCHLAQGACHSAARRNPYPKGRVMICAQFLLTARVVMLTPATGEMALLGSIFMAMSFAVFAGLGLRLTLERA